MADRIDQSIPSTNPLRLSAARAVMVRPIAQAPRIVRSDVETRAGARLDTFQFSSAVAPQTQTAAMTAASRMVAATVPGAVNFRAETPAAAASLPLYRHPADRNAAATMVNAGRVLDVEG